MRSIHVLTVISRYSPQKTAHRFHTLPGVHTPHYELHSFDRFHLGLLFRGCIHKHHQDHHLQNKKKRKKMDKKLMQTVSIYPTKSQGVWLQVQCSYELQSVNESSKKKKL